MSILLLIHNTDTYEETDLKLSSSEAKGTTSFFLQTNSLLLTYKDMILMALGSYKFQLRNEMKFQQEK